jgi:transketolase
MRPALRLAAMSRYPVIFIYTHDSIGLGEDGPTHQPVEHLAALRTLPGMIVLRPADANETAQAWKFVFGYRAGPTVIALTRQKLPVLNQQTLAPADGLVRGAYTLMDAQSPRALLIATGSEVHLAIQASARLSTLGIPCRVVSMPSWELFERQTREYRDAVLPPRIRARVVVEAGVQLGWDRYMGDRGKFVGMNSFGASAPADVAYNQFGITVDAVVRAAQEVIE